MRRLPAIMLSGGGIQGRSRSFRAPHNRRAYPRRRSAFAEGSPAVDTAAGILSMSLNEGPCEMTAEARTCNADQLESMIGSVHIFGVG